MSIEEEVVDVLLHIAKGVSKVIRFFSHQVSAHLLKFYLLFNAPQVPCRGGGH
jgi:hypothetical protein